jgi:hypothetical protein
MGAPPALICNRFHFDTRDWRRSSFHGAGVDGTMPSDGGTSAYPSIAEALLRRSKRRDGPLADSCTAAKKSAAQALQLTSTRKTRAFAR